MTRLETVEGSLAQRFESVAHRHADRLAVTSGARRLTYRQLDAAATRVANGLTAAVSGAGPHRIALMLTDRVDQLIAILAVLKTGHACVPLDGRQSPERLALLFDHADPAALVTDDQDRARAMGVAASQTLDLHRLQSTDDDRPLRVDVADDALAYILYTSGSTGEPKGVMQTHRNVMLHALKYGRSLGARPDDRMTWLHGYEFALSMSDVFGALLHGAASFPYAIKTQGLAALAGWLREERITVYASVPTIFRRLCRTMPEGQRLVDLRMVRIGGEPVSAGDVDLFRQRTARHATLLVTFNMSEINGITQARVEHDTITSAGLSVGHPMEAVDVLILSEDGAEAGTGTAGEIAIRSPHLSPGYWRRPDLTERAMVPDPGGRGPIFKTGDLGRLRADGSLEHLGRKDAQVKVNGMRIEPAEIEAALVATAVASEACVVTGDGGGDPRLVAYVVWQTAAMDLAAARARLAARLPDYMMPSELVAVDTMPLLPTGKVDRRALAGMAPPPRVDVADSHPPRDLVELRLARAWENALGVGRIHPRDDFFALGGHSLAAAQLFDEIHAAFGVNLPLTTLVDAPTLEKLAALLRRTSRPDAWSPIVPLQTDGHAPPVYIVPGAGSDVLSVCDLARCLAGEQPVYGIQPPGVDGSLQGHRSVEEMAAYHVGHLRAHQASGPYFLVGSSFGGVVAFEMARQLTAGGRAVAFLAVIDTHMRDYPRPRRHPSLRQRAHAVVRWCLPFANKEELTWSNLRRGLHERRDRILANLDMMRPRRTAPPPHVKRFLYLQEVSFRAQRRYVPRPFPGRVVLLRNATQPPATLFEPDPELGWHGLAEGGLEIHEVPGAHGEQIREPHVQVTARTLKACLRRARQGLAGA